MRKVLLTLGKSFFEAYPRIKTDLEKMELTVDAIVSSDKPVPKSVILDHVADAEIYIMGVERVDSEILDRAVKLRYIPKHGAGLDNLDLPELASRGIPATYCPAQNSGAVADHALGLILSLARSIPQAHTFVKAGGWQLFMGNELAGKTLGIVGFGAIGRSVAARASAFGMRVIANDAFWNAGEAERLGAERVEIDELAAAADFITIHVPLTPETHHLFGPERLAAMKSTACIINTARGDVIDEPALIDALRAGRIRGAALDVFHSEPPARALTDLDNIILTPHIGGSTYECAQRLGEITVENVRNYLEGRPLRFPVPS